MKNLIRSTVILVAFLITSPEVSAQEITKYDFIEVIVIQKTNNSGKIKRIKVEDQEASLMGKIITIKEIEDLKSTAELLNYMNAANWEFIERQAIVSEENDPVWMSYIFRKQKLDN